MKASSSSVAASTFNFPAVHGAAASSSRDETLEAIEALGHVAEPSMQKDALNAAVRLINQNTDPTNNILELINVMLRTNRFDCTVTWQALIRLEPLIENKQALAQAAAQLYLPEASPASLEQAQGALWFAAYTGNVDLASEAIRRGAQVNTPIYPLMSALLLACKRGHDDLAYLLLNQGSNVKFIGGTHHHETPLSEALFRPEKMSRSLSRLLELDNGFSKEFHARKQITHEFSKKTASGQSVLEGIPFYLEGYRPRYILNNYLIQSRPFYEALKNELLAGEGPIYDEVTAPLYEEVRINLRENPEAREKLCRAIDEMLASLKDCLDNEVAGLHENPELMTEKAIQRLDEGKPAVCFGVTRVNQTWKTGAPNSHAWGLVITGDTNASNEQYIVQRCNRGFGATSYGILTRKMSREEVHALIGSYYKAANWKEVFLNSGEQILNEIETQMAIPGHQHTEQKLQLLGICCYYSAQSIVRALLDTLFIPALGEGVDKNQAMGKSVKAVCTSQTRPISLGNYLSTHYGSASSSPPLQHPEQRLLIEIVQKTAEKQKLARCYTQFSSDVLNQLNIENENVALEKIWEKNLSKSLSFSEGDGPVGHEAIRSWLNDPANTTLIQQVKVLYLNESQLKVLPPEIGKFTALESLDLNNNQLTSLPAEIGNLTALQRLYLDNNKLISLPEQIGSLTALLELSVYNNQINSLPEQISGLTALETLLLTNNKLTSTPEQIGDLTNLKKLYVDNNQLTSVPEQIGNLTALLELSVCNNQINSLPEQISGLAALVTLLLTNNKLTSIPEQIGDLTNLKKLYVDNNQLTSVPEQIGNLINLEILNFNENKLTSLPERIMELSSLKTLYLSNNLFSSFPVQICSLNNLDMLHLNDNQLTSLPEQIGNLTALLELSVCNNQLTSIPEQIGKLKKLQTLYLSYNQLSSIPDQIGSLNGLESLSLNHNQLSSLPQEISGLVKLKRLFLYDNQLTSLPNEIGDLKELFMMFIYNNPLLIFIFDSDIVGLWNSEAISKRYKNFNIHPCQTPLATLYQSIGINKDGATIQSAFANLSIGQQQEISSSVEYGLNNRATSSSSSSSSSSSETSLFANVGHFAQAVRRFIYQTFENLPEEQKNAVYLEICKLNKKPEDVNWGKKQASKNVLCFVEALETITYLKLG